MSLPPLSPAPGAPGARRLARSLWAFWDRLAIYLPLVLMALLALGTYWMVRVSPPLPEVQEARPPTHEVDYFMRGAVIRTYDESGRLQQRLAGAQMRHFGDDRTMEIDQPVWWSRDKNGRITHGRALRSLGRDDGSEAQLMGQAVVVRDALNQAKGPAQARLEFRGEYLHIFADDERVQSHLPVEIFSGEHQFKGNTFSYDHTSGVAQLQGRVTARLMPDTTAPKNKASR